MSSNSIGKTFVITSFGESHGKCVGIVIDGCPAGLPLSKKDIQIELEKRRPGFSEISTQRREEDQPEIISGVHNGFTTGAPLTIVVWNKDVDSKSYELIRDRPRPGHADYTARMRYGGFNDYRGGGRFSGRITASFTMAGAIAKKLLKRMNVEILAHTVQIGDVKLLKRVTYKEIKKNVYQNNVRCADLRISELMEKEILESLEDGDSLGGIVEGIALGIPAGLGNPIFDTLDADLSKILFNIPSVKGIEIGTGFKVASLRGSENNDPFMIKNRKVVTKTNNAGGILGGLSTGMPIVVRIAFKPPSSITKKQRTVNLIDQKEDDLEILGRHDPCIVPRAVPVVESCMALILVDHSMRLGLIPPVLN